MSSVYPSSASVKDRREFFQFHMLDMDQRRRANPVDWFVPFPWQVPFLESRAKERLCITANRTGGTAVTTWEAAALMTGRLDVDNEDSPVPRELRWWTKSRPPLVWFVTTTHSDSKLNHRRRVRGYLPPGMVASWPNENADNESHLTLKNGAEAVFKAFKQGRTHFQQAAVDLVLIAEQPPDDIYDECDTRTVDTKGRIVAEFTPLEGIEKSKKIHDRLYIPWRRRMKEEPGIKAGNVGLYSHITTGGMRDNPLIDPKEIERLEERYKHRPLMLDIRTKGIWHSVREEAVINVSELLQDSIPDNWPAIRPNEEHHGWADLIIWIDANFGEGTSEESSEFCISVAGRDRRGHVWLIEQQGGHFNTDEKLAVTIDVERRWGCPPTFRQPTGGDNLFEKLANKELMRAPGCRACISAWDYRGPIPGKSQTAELFCVLVRDKIAHIGPDHAKFIDQAGTLTPGSDKHDWLDSGMNALLALAERGGFDAHEDLREAGVLPLRRQGDDDSDQEYAEDQDWYYDTESDGLPDF